MNRMIWVDSNPWIAENKSLNRFAGGFAGFRRRHS